ncbi:MAG: Nif3-like dinuclear metal center hexameric protein [Flavonifractor plautii]
MATVREIYQYLDGLAPFSLQMEFDNAGFLVGRGERAVSKILVSLDITEEVAEEAAELGAELIVSHHPVILPGQIRDGRRSGRTGSAGAGGAQDRRHLRPYQPGRGGGGRQ